MLPNKRNSKAQSVVSIFWGQKQKWPPTAPRRRQKPGFTKVHPAIGQEVVGKKETRALPYKGQFVKEVGVKRTTTRNLSKSQVSKNKTHSKKLVFMNSFQHNYGIKHYLA